MHTQRYFIITYGCQMNERDSELLAGLLEEEGYSPAETPEAADVVVINTCCVRESAERKILGRIGQLRRLKRERPGLVLAVGGCLAQMEGAAERLLKHAPDIDVVFGTHNAHRLAQLVATARAAGEPTVEVWRAAEEPVEHLPARRSSGVSAWCNVMFGCTNFCSYCIVPYVRGPERSRLRGDIMAEVEGLLTAGYREVTLLGQNVNAYGRDLDPPDTFSGLLRAVDGLGVERIRFVTSHPRDFGADLVTAIAECGHVCEHVHLPAQAGSDRILAAMNRGYDRRHYLGLVRRLRQAVPGVAVTTDLIVGFPGETDQDFADTLDLVKEAQFDAAFTFLFSPRRGTPAAALPEQVPAAVKQERLLRLVELQNEISAAHNQVLVGTDVEVLVEGPSRKDPARLSGRTRTNRVVVFNGEAAAGALVWVTVTRAYTFHLVGEPVGGRGVRRS